MRIMVSGDGIAERFGGMLVAAAADIDRALVQGLNEGGDLETTQARRNLRGQTNVKRYGTVLRNTGQRKASAGNLEYRIEGRGPGLPIKEFPVRASVRTPVSADPWGVGHTFARSFKTRGRGLLLAREGGDRLPVRKLYGPSIAKEIVKDETAADFEGSAGPRVEGAVFKRLGRLLP